MTKPTADQIRNYIDSTVESYASHALTIQWDEGHEGAFRELKRFADGPPAPASEVDIDAACERFNNAMAALVEAQLATDQLDPDPPDYETRNRALEEAWAAYQVADCPCSAKP
jgi:hypothetical protein